MTEDKEGIKALLCLPWQLKYNSNLNMWLMSSIQRKLSTSKNSISLKTKELIIYHCGCHVNIVIISTEYVVGACYTKKLHSKYELITT